MGVKKKVMTVVLVMVVVVVDDDGGGVIVVVVVVVGESMRGRKEHGLVLDVIERDRTEKRE